MYRLSAPDTTGSWIRKNSEGSWIRKNSEMRLNSCESSYEERFCQGFSVKVMPQQA